VLYKLARH